MTVARNREYPHAHSVGYGDGTSVVCNRWRYASERPRTRVQNRLLKTDNRGSVVTNPRLHSASRRRVYCSQPSLTNREVSVVQQVIAPIGVGASNPERKGAR